MVHGYVHQKTLGVTGSGIYGISNIELSSSVRVKSDCMGMLLYTFVLLLFVICTLQAVVYYKVRACMHGHLLGLILELCPVNGTCIKVIDYSYAQQQLRIEN